MRYKLRGQAFSPRIDLIPYVTFVLLFFIYIVLVFNQTTRHQALQLAPPTLDQNLKKVARASIQIVVDRHGVLYLGEEGEVVDLFSLPQKLEALVALEIKKSDQAPAIGLILDRRLEYGTFLRLFEIASRMGVPLELQFDGSFND